MRADAHYIDQLESRYGGPAIRLIPTRQIDSLEPVGARVEALAQSIAAHGILQPLLVRRQNGRYQVIAGRKRLAAAASAGVAEVPCLVYEVSDEQAAALARADNVRGSVPAQEPQTAPDPAGLGHLVRALSVELAAVGSTAALLRAAAVSSFSHRIAADLIQAQAWRLTWLGGVAAAVGNQQREGAARPVSAILDRVRAGFDPEIRLTRLRLDCSVSRDLAGVALDEDLGVLAVTGCVFATLSWMDGVEEPHVEVRADAPTCRMLRIEIVQRMATVPAEVAAAALGVLTAKSIAVRTGGNAKFSAIGSRGSVIRSSFGRQPDTN